jgi:cobalt-zinc-cadmium efflux system outer membrane protein
MFSIRVSRAMLTAVAACLLPLCSAAADDHHELTMSEAQRLAVTHQPTLQAQASAVEAARSSAISAAQLPDPKLTTGITDWPVEGEDRYSLRHDDFTMVTAGLMQEFPRAEKRRLRGQRGEHEAQLAEQTLTVTRLMMEREAGLAWLDVWKADRARDLLLAAVQQAELQTHAAEIAYTTNMASQSSLLESQVSLGLLRDEVADAEQQAQDARNQLSRWLGAAAADRPVSRELPQWHQPPALPQLLEQLRRHPHLNVEAKRVELAEDDVALAKQAYKPDWGLAVDYGYRPDFADFVSLNVTIDLPVFSHDRQDRDLSAKLAEQAQAEQQSEAVLREQEAELRRNAEGLVRQQSRIQQFDEDILPKSRQRTDSAIASWQAGQGNLMAVLDARRMTLDNEMKRLDLVADAARRRVNLEYYAGEAP